MSFDTLGLHPLLVQAVAKAGYETPTPVQNQAIPEAISGRDLMVSAATGSGKTAAFMLPALQLLTAPTSKAGKGPRVVVLTPTRELAMQVTQACEAYGRVLPTLRTVSILGGVPYVHQQRLLRQFVDVMVATPGRLIDYLQRGMVDFSRLEMLVLDEADRMLDMGFIEDIEHIVSKMPVDRQTLMFSATFGGHVGKVAQQWLRDPLPITVDSQSDTHENIEQRLHYTRGYANKVSVLEHLLRDATVNQAIVFTATQREADALSDSLMDQGFVTGSLHGGMNQRQRNRTLQQMRQGRLRVLVATDVAARGLDVQGISHVINFDLPKMAEDYVHRIGRTGRAGRQGVALTLADVSERRHVQRIERFTTQRITVHAIEGLAPIPDESAQRDRGAGRGEPRRSSGPRGSRFEGRGDSSSFSRSRSNENGGAREYRGRGTGGRDFGNSASAPQSNTAPAHSGRGYAGRGDSAAATAGSWDRDRPRSYNTDGQDRRQQNNGNGFGQPSDGRRRSFSSQDGAPRSSARFDGDKRNEGGRSEHGRSYAGGGASNAAATTRRRREWSN